MSDFLLHELAALGDWKQIEVLFRINAVKDVNLQDEDFEGQTALHWAVRKGNLKCCEVLLQHGADPSLPMFQGWTPAHCAAEIGNIEILQLIYKHCGVLTSQDIFGATPKHLATTYNHKDCVVFLNDIEEGREPTMKVDIEIDKNKKTNKGVPESKIRSTSTTLSMSSVYKK